MPDKTSPFNYVWIGLFFCIIILGCYANSFTASWHFDDKPNILNNRHLHIKDLKPSSLIATLYSNPRNPYEPGKKLYRPVACLSFALNWYIGQNDPFGYHVTNVVLHLITTFLLYFFMRALYDTPNLKRVSNHEKLIVPIVATSLWALNPIQTQAVVYIVQRMAVLGAMFYIMGMIGYLWGRSGSTQRKRISGFVACAVCYLLALGSKENTFLMPLLIILMEFAFFQDLNNQKIRHWLAGIILTVGVVAVFVGFLLFYKGDPDILLRGYATRPFGLLERLLTEPRIIVHYLSQIFYPLPTRFSIDHDVLISKSLWQPWTTSPACLFVVGWLAAGIVLLRKHALIGFSLLFFMVNHLIESSIIPLELVFEHRNYLPSMFLFIPVGIGLYKLIDFYQKKDSIMQPFLWGFIILLVFGSATSTHIRNRAWKTERSLWMDAAQKAPQSARPLTNLAWDMTYGANANPENYDNALKLYSKALNLYQVRNDMDSFVLNNMAGIYFKKKEYKTAILLLKESISEKPSNLKSQFDLAFVYVTLGQWAKAEVTMESLIAHPKVHEGYLNQYALILLHQNRATEAVPILKKSLQLAPSFWKTLTFLGVAFKEAGEHEKADKYLKNAWLAFRNHPLPLFCLIDNAVVAKNSENARNYVGRLFELLSLAKVQSFLEEILHDNHVPPISYSALSETITEYSQEMGDDISVLKR